MNEKPRNESYPVFEPTEKSKHDIGLPRVRQLLFKSAESAISLGLPISSQAAQVIKEDHPELASKLRLFGDDNIVKVKPISSEEENSTPSAGIVSSSGRHSSGMAAQSVVKNDYNGNLWGAPLRIGGLVHK